MTNGTGIRRSCAAARGADIAARCPYHAKHTWRPSERLRIRAIGIFDRTANWHETRCSRTANEAFAFLRDQSESPWDKNGRHWDIGDLDPHGRHSVVMGWRP